MPTLRTRYNITARTSSSTLVRPVSLHPALSYFVHEDIAESFINELKTRFEQLAHAMGQPTDSNTFLGPLADGKQFERVMSFLDIGKEEAELLTGGGRHGDNGWYIQPTIFLNPKDDARIYREEIFGPVLTIRTFKTEEEAIKLANDTSFGLSCECFECLFAARKLTSLQPASSQHLSHEPYALLGTLRLVT